MPGKAITFSFNFVKMCSNNNKKESAEMGSKKSLKHSSQMISALGLVFGSIYVVIDVVTASTARVFDFTFPNSFLRK